MSLSSVSIERPVLTIVMSTVIMMFGFIGFTYLGIREYPSVDPPVITVSTNYTGANSDVIESQITEPLEESINGIAGIRTLTSVSRDGRSTITVEFDLDVDLEAAANDVRDRVSRALANIPPDADPPVVSKADADSNPIVFMTISSEKRDLLELTEIANNTFKERFQTIPGVSEIRIWGERKYAMRLWLDPAKLTAYGLTPLDVRNALQRENIELPSGSIEGNKTELTVRTLGRLVEPSEFNNLILKEDSGRVVKFQDIGYAELGSENLRTVLRNNGVPMVGNAIIPQPGSNHIEIADAFYKKLEEIKKDMPADLKVSIGFDTTKFIRRSISEVEETIIIAFVLVALIIFLFLRDWRTTLIPLLAIPVSLIGAFFIMYIAGFSINVLTLLGIVLAIGLVVDDAIVVLENIYAKIENGMEPRQAAFEGSKEIFFAVIATTIALAAVFLPVIFLQGLTGRLFREFGIVLAGSVIISAFVALTLTPMLSARMLKHGQPNWFYRKTEPFFESLTNGYKDMLEGFLRHRWISLVIMAVSIGMLVLIFRALPSELAPLEDRSALRVSATGPEGASFEYMDGYIMQAFQLIDSLYPESTNIVTVTAPGFGASSSVNSGMVRLTLKEPNERERTQNEIALKLGNDLKQLPAARSFIIQEQTIGGGTGAGAGLPVQYVIQTSELEKLKEVLPQFMAEASQSPVFQLADLNLKFNKPELQVEIDREKSRALGVSTIDIAQTLQLGLSGQRFGYFIMRGKQYQVIGQISRQERNQPLDLTSMFVRNDRQQMIQLDNVVSTKEESNPPQRFRYNRFASATVSASLNQGYTIGDGIAEMDRIKEKVLDETYSTALSGASKDFAESSSSLLFAFMLALALIYLILAAQFESFLDPIIIMFTVPLALAGAVLTLWLFGQTLNIFSQIGIIMLIGLVTKNGILIVEFANQRKETGLKKMDAIKEAAVSRFRPIIMTSLATVLGAVPIALALGAGSTSRAPMGIAVIGGLLFSTVLTLFVIPAFYSYISREHTSTNDSVNSNNTENTAHAH
ncbi:MAG: efflux RND transporter permease subunit [Chitinophagales bacterium]|nr:efflux RND transporter permease subunit [Chitinophagales bacterium]